MQEPPADAVAVPTPTGPAPQQSEAPAATDSAAPPPTVAQRYATLLSLLLMVAAGIGVRLWLAASPDLVNEPDMVLFLRWARGLAEHNLSGFYAAEGFCDYTPLSLLIFYGVGHLGAALDRLQDTATLQMLLKLPACLADLLLAVLLALEARRLFGPRAGLPAFALFFLNPVVIYNSAYWGQVDSIFTTLIVAALLCTTRRWWLLTGALAAAALLTKFQAIALVPLLLLEAYRVATWRAVAPLLVAAVAAAAVILAPFAWAGCVEEALKRPYVQVIGQYSDLSKGAFNLWAITGMPEASDTSPLPSVLQYVANGAVQVSLTPDDGRSNVSTARLPLLWLTWRHTSLILYALAVVIILSLYAWRPTHIGRYGAAMLLSFAFFLLPTEMHERYAFPALACGVVWALADAWRERAYLLFSGLMLLNLAAVTPAGPLGMQIGAANVLLFAVLLLWLFAAPRSDRDYREAAMRQAVLQRETLDTDNAAPRRLLIVWFQRATALAALLIALGGAGLAYAARVAPPVQEPANTVYLSRLAPSSMQQGWGHLGVSRSVSGDTLRLGNTLYLRGIGTHAPARLVYDVPPGAETFAALAGIDHSARGRGSAVVTVLLDNRRVLTTPRLTGTGDPYLISVPVSGARRLTLDIDPTRDGQRSDHVSFALARFELTPPTTAPASQPAP